MSCSVIFVPQKEISWSRMDWASRMPPAASLAIERKTESSTSRPSALEMTFNFSAMMESGMGRNSKR